MPKVKRPPPRAPDREERDERPRAAPHRGGHVRTADMMPYSLPWLRRKFSVYAFGTVLTAAVVITFAAWMGGGLTTFGKRMDAGFTVIMGSVGLGVKEIKVEGVDDALRERMLTAAELGVGKSMLGSDPYEIKRRIEALPTVGEVRVHRLWPHTISIVAEARKPMAMWHQNGHWSVIDQRGNSFAAAGEGDYAHLPRVEGEGAATAAPAFIALMSDYPELNARMVSAQRTGERRWNVRFRGGVEAVLPEDDKVRGALSAINLLHARNRVLDLPIARIDCRHPERCAVRPQPGAPPGGA